MCDNLGQQIQLMNKKVNKYLAGNVILQEKGEVGALVLGDCNSAIDLSIIKSNKIKTIISIGLQAMPSKQKLPENVSHHFYDIHDNKQQKLPPQLLDEVADIINQGRQKGGVLVHCYAGVSRSSSFVIAYLINTKKVSYDEAKERVKKCRPCVHPGDGFVHQLHHYAKIIAKREEDRLALQKLQQKKQTKQIIPEANIANNETSSVSERVRRGVRGAVRSAENFSPQKIKSMKLSEMGSEGLNKSKIQQKQQEAKSVETKQKQQKFEKLPPISIKQSSYERSLSHLQMKRNIQKIEGRPGKLNIQSIRGIYGNKTKIK